MQIDRSSSNDTPTWIMETAERLCAERGIYAVSMREIGAAAGQRNTGAARYHFGSKDALVDAVLRYRMVPINTRREAMLADFEGNDLRLLTEAFVYPLSEQLGEVGRPSWYMRFLLQAALVRGSAATREGDQPWKSGGRELGRRFLRGLEEIGIPAVDRSDRWTLYAGFIIHALADREQALQLTPEQIRTPRAVFLAHVVDTATALAAAPLTNARTRRRLA